MALEDALVANTAAIDRFAAAVEKLVASGIVPNPPTADAGEAASPAAEQPAKRGPGRPRKDQSAPAATEAAAPAEPADEKPAVPTADEVRAAVFKVKDTLGEAAAKNLIKTAGGADKLGAVAEDKRAALIAACKVALETPAPAEDDDGGL